MDWNNVDLNSTEVNCKLIDPLTFAELLLEIHCNIEHISEETITQQFEDDLKSRVVEARSIFRANLRNILAKAIEQRKKNN